ncbi:MAG: hypothetical protein Q8N77_04905 [Nanoarchaeota archaeon]|nr:hypothetical protein [Nanoarchaeota archaeon]
MKEIRDKCAVCGKEIVISDKNMIANLQNVKGKDSGAKLYCSSECRKKDHRSMEGCLDVGEVFS